MPRYRALRGFSYLADETEHLAAVAGDLAYEAGHRTRVEAGQVVDNLPAWVSTALTMRGHIEDADAPASQPSAAPEPTPEAEPETEPETAPEPVVAEPEPAPAEPGSSPAEPVIDYTTDPTELGEPAPPETTP